MIHVRNEGAVAACTGCRLRTRDLCAALSASGLTRTAPRLRRLRRGAVVQDESGTPRLTGILRNGYLRTERMMQDGRRNVLVLSTPGDLVGDWTAAGPSYAVSAATDVEMCVFDARALRHAAERDASLHLGILREVSRQHGRLLEQIWRRGALHSRERVIAFMLLACEIMPTEFLPGGGAIVGIEVSRRDWADMAGTTVETICRVLAWLSGIGAVETLDAGRYRIRDLAELTALAGLDAVPCPPPGADPVRQCPAPGDAAAGAIAAAEAP
ncbi:Crp/Fnr family transcriptional regulator [Roseicyclus sp.]|uniref:Crp/Fnr family transcriptional regulator n=1 Tax=Roseicyclus sp. TaxID=1914329 RepID=UPI003F9F93A3